MKNSNNKTQKRMVDIPEKNQATEKSGKEMESRMKAITGGINIPGLNF